ncbi:hypothetical protein BJX64DRAFT_272637 [Aspergillus heterothallicus]
MRCTCRPDQMGRSHRVHVFLSFFFLFSSIGAAVGRSVSCAIGFGARTRLSGC